MTVGSEVKSCFSSIKSAEATVEALAAKIQDEKTKAVFTDVQQMLTEVKEDIKKQVIFLSIEEPQYK